jgi:hypothetical protein
VKWASVFTGVYVVLGVSFPGHSKELIQEWHPELIARYESLGGKNVPNYRYDGPGGRHSAAGACQMTDTNWQRVAPTIGIDIQTYRIAGTASEFDQWRACYQLWVLDGYDPWTCCNPVLRQIFGASESPRATNREPLPTGAPSIPVAVRPPGVNQATFVRPGPTPSVVFFAEERK